MYKKAYKLDGSVDEQTVIKDDNLFIPTDEKNSDYQQYLLWVLQGGVIDD